MTEAEWLACSDPQRMLAFLRTTASDRKLRLFACACCRRIVATRSSADTDLQNALTIAENLCERTIRQEEALQARKIFESVNPYSEKWSAFGAVSAALDTQACLAAECAARHAIDYFGHTKKENSSFLARILGTGKRAVRKPLFDVSAIVRDIFGNPFRSVALDPTLFIPAIKRSAETVYANRAFDRLPILADALEDTGCTNADILNHCRQPGEHVRGCWVVDLLLGKE